MGCIFVYTYILTPILTPISDYLLAWYTYLPTTYLSALNVP